MISFIAILMFLIVQSLFNEYAPPQHTGWSIFYYCTLWLSFILISIDNWIKDYSTLRRKTFLILTIPMFYQLGLHLSCINKTYTEWYRIIDSRLFEIIFITLILLTSLYVIIDNYKLWAKSLKKIGM